MSDSLAVVAAEHVTLRNALAIQIFPLDFPWPSRDDVPHSVLNRDLPGMVRMEEGQVSGLRFLLLGLGVGHRGQARILCFTGRWLWKTTWKEHRTLD